MRRPIPSMNGGPPATPAENPDEPEDLDPDDPESENPDYNGGTTDAWYYAYGVCNGSTVDVTCNEMTYDADWQMQIREGASQATCQQQDPDSSDYQTIAQIGPRPEGSFIVHPANVASTQGASCDSQDVTVRDHIVVSCNEFLGEIRAYCESHTMQTHNGQTTRTGMNELSDGECVQDSSYEDGPGYQDFLNNYGYYAAGPEGVEICQSALMPDPNEPQEGFLVDRGECKSESYSNPDGSTTIERSYQWDCRRVTNFNEGTFPNGPTYQMDQASAFSCEYANQSAEDRKIIADWLSPPYNDPQNVDTSCEGELEVLGEWRVEVAPAPSQTRFYEDGADSRLYKDGFRYSNYDTPIYTETFNYYCHRYPTSIFDKMIEDPDIVWDTSIVDNRYRNAFEGVDCPAMLEEKAKEYVPDQDAGCLAWEQAWAADGGTYDNPDIQEEHLYNDKTNRFCIAGALGALGPPGSITTWQRVYDEFNSGGGGIN